MTTADNPRNQEFQVRTESQRETFGLGEAVGRAAGEGLIIALIGDLGCGKTVFVKGLASGLAVPAAYVITSPSYTLIHEYPGRIRLFHADLYRLSGTIDIESTGLFEILTAGGVVAIEWAERLSGERLNEDIRVCFESSTDETRLIRLTGCGQMGVNLLRGLKI